MLQEQFLRLTYNEIIITFTSAFNNQYNYYRGLISVFSTGTWAHIIEYVFLATIGIIQI